MTIISLPETLPGKLDLKAINAQLRAGTATLDWGATSTVREEDLEVLLEGLDLSEHADRIGIDDGGISDEVAMTIDGYFRNRKPAKKSPAPVEAAPAPSPVQPEVWTNPDRAAAAPTAVTPPPEFVPVPSGPILKKRDLYQIREKLEQKIIADLLGPVDGPEEEVDETRVSERYLVGVLAPKGGRLEIILEDDELTRGGTGNDEEGEAEPPLPIQRSMIPSSIGLSFCVAEPTKAIRVRASWGQYERKPSAATVTKDGKPKLIWKRVPVTSDAVTISMKEGPLPPLPLNEENPHVVLQGLVRKRAGEWIVSLFLINARQVVKATDRDHVFQPELTVESADAVTPDIFVRRHRLRETSKGDPVFFAEENAMRLLYRKRVEFAIGHGIGVHAEASAGNPERAVRLQTRVIPAYEVPKVTPPTAADIPALAEVPLDMKALAEMSGPDLHTKLGILAEAYAAWIAARTQDMETDGSIPGPLRTAAREVIANCETTLQRMREGIALVGSDPVAGEAFRFANRAMWQQRIHAKFTEKVRRGEQIVLEDCDTPENRTWYPFQVAFMLLNLPSLTNLNHPERSAPEESLVDLLWFPTGGGKTEAYLGLTAYTLGIRRLQGTVEGRSGEYGVAVLMRYTLRLLTLQQFQRATALICACEAIRREAVAKGETKWGNEPFRIGLWVGSATTPNKTSQSEEAIKQARGQSYAGASGTPHQLTNCPWCGAPIDLGQNIKVDPYPKGLARTLIYCGDRNGRCLFSERNAFGEGLPVVVVDEEIYRRLPALLIATVDKFAQMPWRGEVQMLFGNVNGKCSRHGFTSPEIEDSPHQKYGSFPASQIQYHGPLRPPDLIIQDELHLISGPLGSLVGLYETAIDKLMTWTVKGQEVRPKVIASTATIKQASHQVYQLFQRRVQVFPPAGLDVEDNFFALQRQPSNQYPGRKYLGICAPGRKLRGALIRVYLAQLSAAQALLETEGAAKADPWMTLVGYFNSLRELGGMRRVVDDHVKNRLYKMDKRGLAARKRLETKELTSRIPSTEIPVILDQLEKTFRDGKENTSAIDVLLATNMISVGVDVPRLGAMVVAGQPKSSAEYIQATSRVGRHFPGLVLTVYNWARPRDLSHYESFEQYHATFYQHVEALSVTPFAPRAIDRGLAALLVSLLRLSSSEFNLNLSAGAIERNHPLLVAAVKAIIDRANLVGGTKVGDRIRAELDSRLDSWLAQAKNREGGTRLGYEKSQDGITLGLLKNPYAGRWEDFTCLWSLRNVEPNIGLILDDRRLDDDRNRVPVSMNPEEPLVEMEELEA